MEPLAGVGSDIRGRTLEEQLRAKNGVYDSATSVIWRLGVYEPVHEGWRFTNIGGRTVLNFIGDLAKLEPQSCALEIGSGLGDTCRYLVERFGCTVVGVDMNETQVLHARSMAEDKGMTDRLIFLAASIENPGTIEMLRAFTPARGVDLIYTMDVLILTANPEAILDEAVKLLRPGGWLALNEVTSGPAMTEDVRKYLWEMDGMKSLLAPADYMKLIRDAGMTKLRMVDRTPLALSCFRKMADAFAEKRSEIVEGAGLAHYEDWRQVIDLYIKYFDQGQLLYTQLLAT
jgi:cyclopropane fatty-acyl-phospholipid synthase-like methyltransferase